jgi:O-antigen/teichoic acid export membrane protein
MSREEFPTSHGDPNAPPVLTAAQLRAYNARAKHAFLWLFSTTVVWQILSWLMTLWTARVLKASDYGLLAVGEAVFTYFIMLATCGLDTWLIQRGELNERTERSAFSILLLLGLTTSVLCFFAGPLFARWYHQQAIQNFFQILSVTFTIRAIQVIPEARLRRELKFKPIALCNLTVGIIRSVVQLSLAYLGFGYMSLIIGSLVKDVATATWLILAGGIPLRLSWDSKVIVEGLRFGFVTTVSTISWIIFSTADNLLVGTLFGVEVLGYYSMAFFLAELPLSKLNAFATPVLTPYFSKLRTNAIALRRSFLRSNEAIVSIVAPALCGMAVVAPELVPVVLGDKWEPMVIPLQVPCIVGLLRGVTGNTAPLLLATNNPGKLLRWSAINALVLPLCFYSLGSFFGLKGIYLSWIAVYPLTGVYLLLKVIESVIGVTPLGYFRQLRAPLIATLSMTCLCILSGVILRLAGVSPIIILTLNILLGVAAYALSLWCFSRRRVLEIIVMLRRMRSR